jgi:hypothetical protein
VHPLGGTEIRALLRLSNWISRRDGNGARLQTAAVDGTLVLRKHRGGPFCVIQRQSAIFSYLLCEETGSVECLGQLIRKGNPDVKRDASQGSDFISTESQGSLSDDSCAREELGAGTGLFN